MSDFPGFEWPEVPRRHDVIGGPTFPKGLFRSKRLHRSRFENYARVPKQYSSTWISAIDHSMAVAMEAQGF